MITAMHGHCDGFEVTYTKVGEGFWQAEVPADLSDGKYVVDIYAVDTTGYIAYWTGILYMYDSRVVSLKLIPESCVIFRDSTDTVNVYVSPFSDPKDRRCVS